MLNPNQVTEMVRNVLSHADVYSYPMERIIKGTFAINSRLENFYRKDKVEGIKYGMMHMDQKDVEYVVQEIIRFSPTYKKKFFNGVGYDLEGNFADAEFVKDDLCYNVAAQIMICYIYFDSKETLDSDDLEDIAELYQKYWDNTVSREDFISTYKSFFNE